MELDRRRVNHSLDLQRAMAAQVTGKGEGGDMCQHFQLTDLEAQAADVTMLFLWLEFSYSDSRGPHRMRKITKRDRAR